MSYETAVAVIGMSTRLPGARDPRQFWRNLRSGVKSITSFSDEDLLARGVDRTLLKQPNYVRAGTFLDDLACFDASFFGYTPREAEVMDPQLRLFLECAWEAMEDAGCDPERNERPAGIFCGSAISSYMIANLFPNAEIMELLGSLQIGILNSHDSLPSTVAYKLNFRGPSVAVQTFCSTSLVAVHMACQSLLNYECDLVLAGGVAISIPHGVGYLYQEGSILSPDGECRTFDERGQGSVMGSGAGVVTLKRAEEAIEAGDRIYAIIRGSAVNNDGRVRVGYTAPGLDGQTEVIAEALAHAAVDPVTISYVEAHGTATALGDAIELAAMIRAFRKRTDRKRFCAIGSVKPNVGHLDRAAGVTGLIKTVLALGAKEIPASLNFTSSSPEIDLENSPFYVNTELREWPRDGTPRRAGVSSFGLGGTNAHVVLEEAPEVEGSPAVTGPQLLILSAKTASALQTMEANLARFLREHRELELADVAYTLQVGRTAFNHRLAVVVDGGEDAIAALEQARGQRCEQTGRDRGARIPAEAAEWFAGHGVEANVDSTAMVEVAAAQVESEPARLQALGELWLSGVMVDWKAGWADQRRHRVSLPTYPFERRRYWLEAPRKSEAAAPPPPEVKQALPAGKRSDIADWFYTPLWERAPLGAAPAAPQTAAPSSTGRWLVFLDAAGVGEQVASRLAAAGRRVEPVAPGESPDWNAPIPEGVVHLGSLQELSPPPGIERFRAAQQTGFYSVLEVARELGRRIVDQRVELLVVSCGMRAVHAGEVCAAEHATLSGLSKVVGQENPTIRCRSVDLDPGQPPAGMAEAIATECLHAASDLTVAWRGGERWVERYSPLRVEAGPDPSNSGLREGGAYLLVGGLGRVGLAITDFLAKELHARVALIARRAPTPEQQDRLAAMGEILVVEADAAEAIHLRQAVAQVRRQLGPLDGVLHLAGVSEGSAFGPLQELTREQCERHFRSKAESVYALEEALRGAEPGFCVLFSSLSAVLGGLGFGGYAAANSFLDGYAERHNALGQGGIWTSVNWDTWRIGVGEAPGTTVARYEMEAAEAAAVLRRVAGRKEPRIVNSTGDLQERIREWVELESVRAETAPAPAAQSAPSGGDYEERIAALWRQVLGVEQVGLHENFFDLGGNSLIGLQLIARLKKEFQRPVPAVALFEAPTVSALASYLRPAGEKEEERQAARLAARRQQTRHAEARGEIAVIGMAGRFPGADTVDEFWRNLREGVESLTVFTDEELLASGVEPDHVQDPNYVKVRPILRDVEHFDAGLFGYTPREAELMDPQQRLFQECAWEALERSGYDSMRYPGLIGVFGGTNLSGYLMRLVSDPQITGLVGDAMVLENDKDALTMNVSYRLNLRGPSIAVQTFCSTSLVATHLACRSLRNGECDMALAGGVSVRIPVKAGYLYQEGDQVSHDGHCRTFDADADGTMFGDGAAVVVLKRLADALHDGDTIHAVIQGSAVNNDGGFKVGYTAPSVVGQSAVVMAALADAGVSAETIDYVEAHGTATRLGDPIEVASLSKAFRSGTDKRGYCALGSVKPNVGHLDRAAGVTGLIKTVLSLEHAEMPPTLHYRRANPEIDFEGSPFFVNTELRKWGRKGRPRRACVNSLGVGGTNAHVVLEEAPAMGETGATRAWQVLVLTGRSEAALEEVAARLGRYLEEHPAVNLGDVAYTLQVGRRVMEHRRVVVCRDGAEARRLLKNGKGTRQVAGAVQKAVKRTVAFVFGGVGEQGGGVGKELYQSEGVFRTAVDRCARILEGVLGRDIREAMFGGGAILRRASVAQPAAFVLDYALAQMWMDWGVRPGAVMGYSVGEYVAACVAGVMTLEEALGLVARRAQWIEELPGGVMLAVSLDEAGVAEYVGDGVELAAVNSPAACVLGGGEEAIRRVEARLAAREVASRRVETSHAYHTSGLRGVAARVREWAGKIKLQAPRMGCISNVTGKWMMAGEATDAGYWAEHMCRTVRFADGVNELLEADGQVLVEVGSGAGLASFIRQHPGCGRDRMGQVLATLGGMQEGLGELGSVVAALGRLWLLDVGVDWEKYWAGETRRRIPLPTYPFERRRYWIEPTRAAGTGTVATGKKKEIADWFYLPVWKATPLESKRDEFRGIALVFADGGSVADQLVARLERSATVIRVQSAERYARPSSRLFQIRPAEREDYEALLRILEAETRTPSAVVHAWSLGRAADSFETAQERGLYSMMALSQVLGERILETIPITVITDSAQPVGGEALNVNYAPLAGACKVFGQEYLALRCRSVDICTEEAVDPALAELLCAEVTAADGETAVAYRHSVRLAQRFDQQRFDAPEGGVPNRLRHQGVYLILGGAGGIGSIIAEYLARTVQARLIIVNRKTPGPAFESRVKSIEATGGQVLFVAADVGDASQLRAAIEQGEARFGALNGVMHVAGNVDSTWFIPIRDSNRAQCECHFDAKVRGLFALEDFLRGRSLDFCVLFSSISSMLGGLGYLGYTAANCFMDAFAHRRRRADSAPWLTVNWDTWKLKAGRPSVVGATVARYELTPVQALDALARVLSGLPIQVVTSTGDLYERLRQWVRLESVRQDDSAATSTGAPAASDYETRIAALWRSILGVEYVGLHDNFFDLGGNSLIALQLMARVRKEFKRQVPAMAIFEAPTVSALATYLRPEGEDTGNREVARLAERRPQNTGAGSGEIAIVGMAGRFPGAETVEQFWKNLRGGVVSLTHFTDEELIESGVDPKMLVDPSYVKARYIVQNVDQFDAGLFGYTPREAEVMDPQQRLFQECAWEALEHAGYDSLRYPGLIGVFGGTNLNFYTNLNIYMMLAGGDGKLPDFITESMVLENDKDALTLNVSYRLNLRGPSVAVQTFCSTSLVATHLACRSLRNGECDMALAGGVSVRVPVKTGYLYKEGGQEASDGYCRSFDSCANGTVWSDGAAIVLLKRLADALHDGDTIHAVIQGSAVNNDGGFKVGYTAPSVVGQSAVVMAALADAGVSAETIDYVEAHGTATRLGDPIEVASLSKAFRSGTDKRGYCALGSVKPNVGHLDRAAGVTGLIKTVLSLEHAEMPPTLHYRRANPEIDFEGSPFFVNTELRKWGRKGRPRRACVNSLGVGGTNAHVVLEEAPAMGETGATRAWQVLVLTGRSEAALEEVAARLGRYLEEHPAVNLGDVAYTLQVGRRVMEHRRVVVCRDGAEARRLLKNGKGTRQVAGAVQKAVKRTVAFVFGGVGEQGGGVGKELYQSEGVFRTAVDRCARILEGVLGRDIREAMFGGGAILRRASVAQPAAFVLDYALAQMWMDWGVRPGAVMGYSVGEYVAACVAGVMTLEEALGLVARRAQWIEELPGGVMLAVSLDEAGVAEYVGDGVELAAVNSPAACVLGGGEEAIRRVEARLAAREVASRRVETSHAYHTSGLRGVAARVREWAGKIKLQAPRMGCISNVTGKWMMAGEATDAGYWAEHMCRTVRFADGVNELLEADGQVLVEVGSGAGLASFIRQHPGCGRDRMGQVLATLGGMQEGLGELGSVVAALGRLWLLDVGVDWEKYWAGETRRRIPLPTYPFERRRYWIEPTRAAGTGTVATGKKKEIADWFAVPSWKRASAAEPHWPKAPENWLLLLDGIGVGTRLAQWLVEHDQAVVMVSSGAGYARREVDSYVVRPGERADYETLLQQLQDEGKLPQRVVHLWMVEGDEQDTEAVLARGFYSLLGLVQALGDRGLEHCQVNMVSSGTQEVTGAERLHAAKATVTGPCKIIPQEYPNLSARHIDIEVGGDAQQLLMELLREDGDDVVALRGKHRWVQWYETVRLEDGNQAGLRERGVYLITGGMGGIGQAVARSLAEKVQARLVLVGRQARRTAAVEELERLGAEVEVVAADVAEREQIARAVRAGVERFGRIDGVVHTAGVPAVGLMQLKTAAATAAVLRPKVQGTEELARALAGQKLDFVVLFSSVTSATGGGPGQVDYCAANAYVDAWSRKHQEGVGRVVSISWGEWQWDAWQEGLQGFPEEVRRYLIANRRHYGIDFEQGMDALWRVLGSKLAHVFVTTQDLNWMVAGSRRSSAASAVAQMEEERRNRPQYPRPDLASSFIAPGNELEEKIAVLWSQALGISPVGVDDNFFDLGGNSLIGIDIIARLRKEAPNGKLPAHALYEAPTVGALARYLSPKAAAVGAGTFDADIKRRQESRQRRLESFRERAQMDESS